MFELRAPTADDLAAVAAVLAADDIADSGQVLLDEGFVRDEWRRPGFALADDAWVASDVAGAVIGYAQVFREDPDIVESWGVVHPDHRGRGIGTALFDRIEARAIALAPDFRFRHAINARDHAAGELLRARGLRPVRHFHYMQIDLDPRPEPGGAPAGIRIEPPADLAPVHAVLVDAFADDWGYHPEPLDRWTAEQTAGPSHDPSLWLVAWDGDEPVGALTANAWDDRGWVGEVGVRASHRGRGIAGALLRRSFATFADRGLARVLLNVDSENPTGATALYERVGMRVVWRWDLWERTG